MTPNLANASWEEAWKIVKGLQYTGSVTVECGQGVPVAVVIPGSVTRIPLAKQERKRHS